LTTWHCILSAELTKTHSLGLFLGDFVHWEIIIPISNTCDNFQYSTLCFLFASIASVISCTTQIELGYLNCFSCQFSSGYCF